MQQHSLVEESSGSSFESRTFFKESDFTGPTGNGIDLDTELTDTDTFAGRNNEDEAWPFSKDHPPEFTVVHRFTNPAWFNVLKGHVAALYLNLPTSSQVCASGNEGTEVPKDDRASFNQIVWLKLGESLLFCPTAAVKVVGGGIERTEGRHVRFKTRQRVTADREKSKLAAEGIQRTGPINITVESSLGNVQSGGLGGSKMGQGLGGSLVRR
jgi:hypothetical protein